MKVLKPSEAKRHAEQMLHAGEMPTLEELLEAVGGAREEFGPKIEEARQQEKIAEKATKKLG